MIQKCFTLANLLLYIICIGGCAQHTIKEFSSPKDSVVEKTALLTSISMLCWLYENSRPFAYFHFEYQEDGIVKYVNTKTTCDDLIKIGVSNDASKNPTLIGEQIKLLYQEDKPVGIVREDGQQYEIGEYGTVAPSSSAGINEYESLKYFKNSNSENVIKESLLLSNNTQHDHYLSMQAALLLDTNICNLMSLQSNNLLTKQWIKNIRENLINK